MDDSSHLMESFAPYRIINSYLETGVTDSMVCFDNREEILWTGAKEGCVSSYYGQNLSLQSTFAPCFGGTLRDFCLTDSGPFVLTSGGVALHGRDGCPLFNFTPLIPSIQAYNCCLEFPMDDSHSSGTLVLAGNGGAVTFLNLDRPDHVEPFSVGNIDVELLRASQRYTCFGSVTGDVGIFDLRSKKCRHHMTLGKDMLLLDFDLYEYALYMCSHGIDQSNRIIPNYEVSVYDMRMCRLTAPVSTSVAPNMLRFLPDTCGRKCVIIDTDGKYQVVQSVASDSSFEPVFDLGNMQFSPVAMTISGSGECIAVVDGLGTTTALTTKPGRERKWINKSSSGLEVESTVASTLSTHMRSFDAEQFKKNCSFMPVSEIEMTFPSGGYDWKVAHKSESIIGSLTVPLNFAHLEHERRQTEYSQFFSTPPDDDHLPSPFSKTSSMSSIPSIISRNSPQNRRLQMLLSSPEQPILESVMANSCCNALLQALYHITPLSAAFRNHICYSNFCVSCEIGFLFHMMGINGTEEPTHTGNLLRVLRSLPEAIERDLFLANVQRSFRNRFTSVVPNWVEFFLLQTDQEMNTTDNFALAQSIVSKLCGWQVMDIVNHQCGHGSQTPKTVFVTSLQYWNSTHSGMGQDLHSVFRSSINENTEGMMYCQECCCEKLTHVVRRGTVLPESFALNFNLDQHENQLAVKQLLNQWSSRIFKPSENVQTSLIEPNLCRYGISCTRKGCCFSHISSPKSELSTPTFIPAEIWMHVGHDGVVNMVSTSPLARHKWTGYVAKTIIYQLNDKNRRTVTMVRGDAGKWCMFDDLNVTPISQDEALNFELNSKIPCVIFYCIADMDTRCSTAVKNPITRNVFMNYCNTSANPKFPGHTSDIIPMHTSENFDSRTIMALDAEFVSLSENNIGSSLAVVKPSNKSSMAVGRVSVIRGNGPLAGSVFMDEYVVAQDEVEDHLTEFSGIKPGDLCLHLTSKRLHTLKSVYVRLRYLIDAGVVFVGHGINNDFRVINVKVPTNQIIDTVQLFRLPDQRLISLKFLAWYFLGMHVQAQSHDSIEDARTALQLYEKYELIREVSSSTSSCAFYDLLSQMYELGRSLQWKIPQPHQ